MKRFINLSIIFILLLASCTKDAAPTYNPNTKGPLTIEFDNVVGSSDLVLNTVNYTNSSGESFSVTKLKYYVSNFVFTRSDDTQYTVPQESSYFLIDESDEDTHEPLLNIPEGEYKAVSFLVGVDSLRSTMDISQRTGVLDPTLDGGDMYWGWNSGYIFMKMEGSSSASAMGDYMYHIGGFGGYSSPTLNNIRKITLDLTARGVPKVKSGKLTNIHLFADLLKLFNGSATVSIATNPMVMFDLYSANIAGNYMSMFKHDHTEN